MGAGRVEPARVVQDGAVGGEAAGARPAGRRLLDRIRSVDAAARARADDARRARRGGADATHATLVPRDATEWLVAGFNARADAAWMYRPLLLQAPRSGDIDDEALAGPPARVRWPSNADDDPRAVTAELVDEYEAHMSGMATSRCPAHGAARRLCIPFTSRAHLERDHCCLRTVVTRRLVGEPRSEVNVAALAAELRTYPDQYLLQGLWYGFPSGARPVLDDTVVWYDNHKSVQGAREETFLTDNIRKELDLGRVRRLGRAHDEATLRTLLAAVGQTEGTTAPLAVVPKRAVAPGDPPGMRRIDDARYHEDGRPDSVNARIRLIAHTTAADGRHVVLAGRCLRYRIWRRRGDLNPRLVAFKIDICAAFRIIRLMPASAALALFQHLGWVYAHESCPFGYRSSPASFGRLAYALQWALRRRIRAAADAADAAGSPERAHQLRDAEQLAIVDDSCVIAEAEVAEELRDIVLKFHEDMGVPVQQAKLAVEGSVSEELTFGGVVFNFNDDTFRMDEDRLRRYRLEVQVVLEAGKASARALARIFGMLRWAAMQRPLAMPWLFELRQQMSKLSGLPPQVRRPVPAALADELAFWVDNLARPCRPERACTRLGAQRGVVRYVTDASTSVGIGGVRLDDSGTVHWFRHAYSDAERATMADSASGWTISALELLAMGAWLTTDPPPDGVVVEVCMDNMAAVQCMNNLRAQADSRMKVVMQALARAATEHDWQYTAMYIPGEHNVLADSASRATRDADFVTFAQAQEAGIVLERVHMSTGVLELFERWREQTPPPYASASRG